MDRREFFDAALAAASVSDLEKAIDAFVVDNTSLAFVPNGRRPNNRGAIEVATDGGRSIIERVTNAHDALLELEHLLHAGKPVCKSPREAASAWLGVPEKEGLAGLSNKARQDLAARAVVHLDPGEGPNSRLITVIDKGIGIEPDRIETTILSLNESNKIQKHYLAGTYGQGGSSTFAFCRYSLIASRAQGDDNIGFTIVKYEDLPADEYKTGRYVYLVENDAPLVVDSSDGDLKHGTIVRHFGYDLSKYGSPLGPRSLYGMLGRMLFDPVSTVRFENAVHKYNRTIKGARNALNGAVDEGDEDSKGPTLDHHVPLFSVSMGDFGTIGIEYWVLAPLPLKEGKKRTTKPADNFVEAGKPIVLTHNGQNQGELSGRLIREDADYPFLQRQGRIVCHVNCDRLSSNAKRLLFSSTREHSREGFMLDTIRAEIVRALKADDDLIRLNEEARVQSLKEKDEDAQKAMRKRVAKLLKLTGASIEEVSGAKGKGDTDRVSKPRPPRPKPMPINPQEPPTFIRLLWEEGKPIDFYSGRRRYLRIETDANSTYHNADDPTLSRINIVVGDDLILFGTSPLTGGRMRIGVECPEGTELGRTGSIRAELYRPGMSALSDERQYEIVPPPDPKDNDRKSTFPDFEVIPVSGPQEDDWQYISPEPDDTDVMRHASNSEMNAGKLYVYYSEAFPRFARELRRLEQRSPDDAELFRSRYETWLAVHALIMQDEADDLHVEGASEDAQDEMLRQERCRLATVSAIMASQEVTTGMNSEEED
jgi:hypothetical protein